MRGEVGTAQPKRAGAPSLEAHSGVVGAPCGAPAEPIYILEEFIKRIFVPGDLEGEPCGWEVVHGWQEVEVGGLGVGR